MGGRMNIIKAIVDSVVFIIIVALGFSLGTVQGIVCLLGCYIVARIMEGKDGV
jgi:hypothetical protein